MKTTLVCMLIFSAMSSFAAKKIKEKPEIGFVKKKDILGSWSLIQTQCSKGERVENTPIDGKLVIDDERIVLETIDKEGVTSKVVDSNAFTFQENLLSIQAEKGSTTFEVKSFRKNLLRLRFPVVAANKACPEDNLLEFTFRK